jgi:NADPH:quinone reductase-like Zn-dependent oxidoreductase
VKAVVCERYGPPDVLQIRELPRPVPRSRDILIRVRATTVSSADVRVRSFTLPAGFGVPGRLALGLRRPWRAVLGTELAGEVAAVGEGVTAFRVGDRVFAYPGGSMGAHAEYCRMRDDGAVALTPASLSDVQAAALCFGGATVLDFFRRGAVRSGDRMLVNGASGTVGTAAVQLGRHLGAHITAVCGPNNIGLVMSLGADRVVDYTRLDFTELGEHFDVIVDTAGTAPLSRSRRCLVPGGRLLLVIADLQQMLLAPWHSLTAGATAERREDVQQLARLAASGAWQPVIDRCFAFDDIVAAHRYVDGGRKRGSVVVTVGEGEA